MTNGTNGPRPERPSDIVERTALLRRDTWQAVIGMCDSLRVERSIDASSEEMAGILIATGIETIKADREGKRPKRRARSKPERAESAEGRTGALSPLAFHGLPVKRLTDTILIALPPCAWDISSGQGCRCGLCHGIGAWDTLAVSVKRDTRSASDRTWTVHAPEMHAASPDAYRALAAPFLPSPLSSVPR
jgi:hypothetical protein